MTIKSWKWRKVEGYVDKEKEISSIEWKFRDNVIVVQKGNGGFWYVFHIKLRSPKSKHIDIVRTLAHFKTKEEAIRFVEKNFLGKGGGEE